MVKVTRLMSSKLPLTYTRMIHNLVESVTRMDIIVREPYEVAGSEVSQR